MLAAVTVGNATDTVDATAADLMSISALIANPGTDGSISLREAITAANNTTGPDTITFDAGVFNGQAADVIRLQSGQLPFITESLHIDAADQGVVITADANGDDILVPGTFVTDHSASSAANRLGDNNGRILEVFASSSDTVRLTGLTITGGNVGGAISGGGIIGGVSQLVIESSFVSGNFAADKGGGIFSTSGNVTLTSSTVSGNSTFGAFGDGGGIYTNTGAVTLTNSTVSGNSTSGATGDGGGIFTFSGAVTLTGSTVSGNTIADDGDDGGGIFTFSGAVTLTGSTVSGNSTFGAFGDGGGIYTNTGAVTLTNSTVSGNSTSGDFGDGGGIYTNTGAVTLTNSTVSGNSTSGDFGDGGGIYTNTGAVTLTNSTVSGNQASGYGGGIYTDDGDVSIQNSTITDNTAGGTGGGIRIRPDDLGESLIIRNSIIAGNSDNGTAPDFQAPGNPANNLTVEFALIGNNSGTTLAESQVPDASGNLVGSAANLIDPMLGPLADYGGPTLTHAPLFGSPALDAGNSILTTDQRGLMRPIDLAGIANASGGNSSDIGAVEFEVSRGLLVTTSTDTVLHNGLVSLREAISFAQSQPGADTITFDSSLSGQTITLGSSLPTLTSSTTINGDINNDNTADITIDGAGVVDRVIGVAFAGTTVTLQGLTITGGNNTTGAGGGGVFAQADTALIVTGSTISGNSSVGAGGGIRAEANTTVNVTGSTISGNSSDSTGGGIHSVSGTVNVTNSTISGNTSDGFGAGLYANTSNVAIESSTITLNDSTTANGAGVTTFGPTTINNSIVAGNLGGTSNLAGPSAGSNFSGDFNLLGPGDATGGAGDITVADNNPLLAMLADNGGPTQTHAPLPGSPAIDAGNSTQTVDQSGVARPLDRPDIANATGSDGSDIGALEARELPSLIVTTASDVDDDTDLLTSLREAINFANSTQDANTITFDTSLSGQTITLGSSLPTLTSSTTINGDIDNDNTSDITIDGAGVVDRVIGVAFAGTTVTLQGLTITGGNNTTGPGGGIFAEGDTTVFVTGSTITGNSATGGGGGIRAEANTALTVTDSTIFGNQSDTGGGGVFSVSGTVDIIGSTVRDNQSLAGGGGIFAQSGSVTLTDSTLSGNVASTLGGGVFTGSAAVTLVGSTISGNQSESGGGIFTFSGDIMVTSSTLSGNTSQVSGGGIVSNGNGNVLITDSTVTGNQANNIGGVFAAAPAGVANLTIAKSIVAGNMGLSSVNDLQGLFTVSFSLIGDNSGTSLAEAQTADANGNLIGTAANLVNPLLGSLANNGGPTQTHAPLPGSPVIDAGNSILTTDQRGFARTFDQPNFGNATGGNGSDIGAHELLLLPGLTVTTSTDTVLDDGLTSLREAIAFAQNQPGADTITFDASLSGQTITLGSSLPTLTSSTTINGDINNDNTADITIDGAGVVDRVIGVAIAGTTVTLQGLTITGGNNTVGAGGAGVFADGDTTVNVIGSTITGNSSVGAGGGIRAEANTTVTVTGSTISGNSSDSTGGGIHSVSGTVNVTGSTISGNTSNGLGAGLFADTSNVAIESSTITLNDSSGANGAGITAFETIAINNSIVAGNIGNAQAVNLAGLTSPTATVSGDFNLLGPGDLTGGAGDIFVADNNPLLAPLADNGGPTQTHALLPGSPALDAGNSSLTTDQRGLTRPVDFIEVANASAGNGSDIGAIELDELPGLIVTTASDVVANDGVTSLREAILFANSQAGVDTISFAAGVFTGGAASVIRLGGTELQISESLVIDGSTGTGVLITADAGNNDTLLSDTFETDVFASLSNDSASLDDNSRVMNFTADTGDLTLNSLTITGGRTTSATEHGGGIAAQSGSVTLNNSTVSGNSVSGDFANGGGIYSGSGAVTLTHSTVTGNSTTGYFAGGGGISTGLSGSVTLSNSTVRGNMTTGASSFGAGIRTSSGSLTLTNSTVTGNSTTGNNADGGGLSSERGLLTLINSTVSGNNTTGSGADGAGVHTFSGTIRLNNSTVSGNQSRGELGGGVALLSALGSISLNHSIVAGNLENGLASDINAVNGAAGLVTASFSLIGTNVGTDLLEAHTADAAGNLIGSTSGGGVIDALLAPLADNGGPTLTHALLPGSPAINAGSNALLPADVNDLDGDGNTMEMIPFDQRGTGFDRISNSRIDIGAFEVQAPPQIIDVIIGGSGFDASFVDAVDGGGLGAGNGLGFSLVGANQLQSLPWQGVDTLHVQFSSNVFDSLADGDFILTGTTGGTYSLGSVSYIAASNVATIPIPGGIGVDSLVLTIFDGTVTDATGNPLDGDWTSGQTTPSGNSAAGGRFDFFFGVLPGDEDGSGQVNSSDAFNIFASNTNSTNDTNFRRDVDGSGQINSADAFTAFGNNTVGLPDPPAPPTPPAPLIAAAAPVSTDATTLSLDVNGDRRVSALDALLVINQLSRSGIRGEGEMTNARDDELKTFDVNGDRQVSALDALLIINQLARQPSQNSPQGITPSTVQSPLSIDAVDEVFDDFDDQPIETGFLF